jgi:hypothetical protein
MATTTGRPTGGSYLTPALENATVADAMRPRLAPGASRWPDPAADPDFGPDGGVRACGDEQVARRRRRLALPLR